METQRTLQALLQIWQEFPRLVGLSWLELSGQLERKLREIILCEDAVDRDWLVVDLLDLIKPFPKAGERLEEVRTGLGMEAGVRHGHQSPPTPVPGWAELGLGISQRLDPPQITRYTDIVVPGSLPLNRRGAVVVRLTCEPTSAGAVPPQLLELRLEQIMEIHLVALSLGVEVLGEKHKGLALMPESDSEPVVFYVSGDRVGRKDLRLDFRQDGVILGTVPFELEIGTSGESERRVEITPWPLVTGGSYVPPPDLDFRVIALEAAGSIIFRFVLHSPNRVLDFNFHEISRSSISGSVRSYLKDVMSTLDRLAKGRDLGSYDQPLSPEQIRRRLMAIGERLFDDLLPPELQQICRELPNTPARTVQITSDEPWLPWELLRPSLADTEHEELWCESFVLSRWLAGRHGQAGRLGVASVACLEAAHNRGQETLEGAIEEYRYLTSMAATGGLEDLSVSGASLGTVEQLLDRGGIDLWHFAAHGDSADLELDDSTIIHLADLTVLRPSDLDRQRQRNIAERKPLVFLNVCYAGQESRTLTGIGGWVKAWVEKSGCGVLIAPLCSVDDQLAKIFSCTFYDALREGATVGQAGWLARQAVKQQRPEDPTWLVYSIYAHPNARVRLPPVEEPTP